MDEDAKRRLDGLALKLQKMVICDDFRGCPIPDDPKGAANWAYGVAIAYLNEAFRTDYQRSSPVLVEHFKEKPCKRR